MRERIMLAVCLESYRPRKDKSFTLTFSTSELSTETVIQITKLHNRMGVMAFVDKEVMNADELAELDKVDIDLEKRSYSQRLRSVLYVLHQQNGGTEDNFKAFYEQKMEQLITSIKNKFD